MRLDLGCGRRGTKYPEFTGVDIWPAGDKLNYMQCDISQERLPFANNSIDEIICTHVLEHMIRDKALAALREMRRLIKPSSPIIIAVPDLRLMAERYLANDIEFWDKKYPKSNKMIWRGPTLADKFLDSILGMGHRGHKYAYDMQSLIVLGEEAGLLGSQHHTHWTADYKRRDHEIIVRLTK